jgi:small subunit ribosomal protein S6
MNQYEAMYIIDTALEDTTRQELIARFSALVEQNGGIVDRVDEWGKRRLAYPINYKTDGYYVLMYVTAPPELPRELERNLQISESVLRYLVTRFEGALPPKREPLKSFAPRAEAAAPAPVAPVAPVAPAAPTASAAPAAPEAAAPEAPQEPETNEEPVAEV